MRQALVLWFTGLSGAGKTTIAKKTADALIAANKAVKIYDGDAVRNGITRHLSFTPEHIIENNKIIAGLCVKDLPEYDYIFVPIIAPFFRCRAMARDMIGEAFRLIYIKASMEEVIRRDPKGLYKKARSGEIANFIGIDENVPYDDPHDADLIIDTINSSVELSVAKLMDFINEKRAGRFSRI